jgi:hypothetical protein
MTIIFVLLINRIFSTLWFYKAMDIDVAGSVEITFKKTLELCSDKFFVIASADKYITQSINLHQVLLCALILKKSSLDII